MKTVPLPLTCFMRVAMPVTSCIKATCYNYLSLLVKGDKIVRPCDRHSNETATVRKYATKYKHMQKWMIEFLRKIENRVIKIA